MNRVFLIGNLTKDPQERAAGEHTLCAFTLAVSRRRKAEGQPDADFFTVTAWNKLGEACMRYLQRGRKCAVSGTIQMRSYEDRDGVKRRAVDIIADAVEFLPSGQREGPQEQAYAPGVPAEQQGFTRVEEEELLF